MPNNDERLYAISQRMLAWSFAGDELPEIFEDAVRRFELLVADYEDFNQLDDDAILTVFEEAFDAYDHVLKHFPQEYNEE